MPESESLAELRECIDALDDQIVALLVERARLVLDVATLKEDEDAVRDPRRIAAVIARARGRAEELGGDPALIAGIYKHLLDSFVTAELASKRRG